MFVETIANPRTQVADLARIGELCRERGILYVVDNTMTTPYLFRPKAVGAGLVVNSLTKSIGGHGMALGGALTDTGLFDWSAYPNIAANFRKLAARRRRAWPSCAPNRCATSAPRWRRKRRTTSRSAPRPWRCAWSAHAPTRWRWHACWKRTNASPRSITRAWPRTRSTRWRAELFRAYGSLFSFELKDGIDCFDYLNRLQLAIPASNLGDTRTLVIPVAHTIFFEMGAERRASMGIAESLIRVSVGIEDTDDLLGDFGERAGGLSRPSILTPACWRVRLSECSCQGSSDD